MDASWGSTNSDYTIIQWVYEIKIEISFAIILILIIQSGHNFAHVMTCAKLWSELIIISNEIASSIFSRFGC